MSQSTDTLALSCLERLQLTTALESLPRLAQQAAASSWSYSHFLGKLLEHEVNVRKEKAVKLNLIFAKLPAIKRLENFELDSKNPCIDKRMIDELATGSYLKEGRNVILLGPPGVGKTHLSIGLAVNICEAEKRAYFTTVHDMAARLKKAIEKNQLKREMDNLIRPSLLVIDEVGYLPLEKAEASLLFQVICERYERQRSIVLTSNKSFSQWADVFAGDHVMASAALDRLLHRATVINIRGESYRMKHQQGAGSSLARPALTSLPAQNQGEQAD